MGCFSGFAHVAALKSPKMTELLHFSDWFMTRARRNFLKISWSLNGTEVAMQQAKSSPMQGSGKGAHFFWSSNVATDISEITDEGFDDVQNRTQRAGQTNEDAIDNDVAAASASEHAPLASPFRSHATRWTNGFDWATIIWVTALHLGALAAPFFFSWQAVALTVVLCWATGSLGICLGYHRLLTHGSLQTYRPIRWFFAWLGGLAGEGPATMWVAVHRQHHHFSDQEGDPHTPHDGAWWSHMLWLVPDRGSANNLRTIKHYAPDLYKDPVMRFLDHTFLLWHFVLAGALFALGYFGWGSTAMGWSFVFWGVFVRMMYVLHVTWFVNSASHMWGYRNYQTTDDSRNCWWVGLLAFGEGWHNNHHAYQRMARHGHRWWEVDVTYWAILAMEKVGLAWHVVHEVRGRKQPGSHLAA
jgi:stearoyl-CoA desaturase (delta-9 desaturase)